MVLQQIRPLAAGATAIWASRGLGGQYSTVSTTMSAAVRVGKLLPGSTAFFACDIQERFRDLIWNMPTVIQTAKFMLKISKELEIPCVVTEQYPKALLHTVEELNVGPGEGQMQVFEKKLFSMCTDDVIGHFDNLDGPRTDVVLFGIEAHVCVTQTCFDLLEKGYRVHVVCDGVSSQRPHDRAVAISRLQQVGAFLTTAEQVAFLLAKSADHPKFKAVSNLVKERSAAENAFANCVHL